MKMNLDHVISNYSHAKSPESIQKELSTISNLEKDLNSIDPNYKDNLFDKLLNTDKNAIVENQKNHLKGNLSGMDIKDAISQMISLKDQNKETTNEDSDEETMASGCPVVNNIGKEVRNEFNFEFAHQVPFVGSNDYLFNFMGKMEPVEFRKKTKLLRSYPRHLKNTLFLKDEKIEKIRKKEFTLVFFAYDEIKEKANKLYKQKKYRLAIAYYTFAYSIMKWLDFKPKKNDNSSQTSAETQVQQPELSPLKKLNPIIDCDVELKTLDISDTFELGSSKTCLCYVLKCLAYCYVQLRDFKEAVKCLDEAESLLGEKVPDTYFRRSQARLFNKDSTYEDLLLALKDIGKALSNIKHESNKDDYLRQLELVKAKIENKKEELINNLKGVFSKAKFSCDRIKEKKLKDEELNFAFCDGVSQKRNYKILLEIKEMYLFSIKVNTENKNETQLCLAYKEYERFLDDFNKFEFYFKFEINDEKLFNSLNFNIAEYSEYFKESLFIKYIDEYRFKECEDIFTNIKFNQDLLNYALEKVLDEERIENTYLKAFNPNDASKLTFIYEYIKSQYKYYFKDTKNLFIFLSAVFMLGMIVLLSFYSFASKKNKSFSFKNSIKFN